MQGQGGHGAARDRAAERPPPATELARLHLLTIPHPHPVSTGTLPRPAFDDAGLAARTRALLQAPDLEAALGLTPAAPTSRGLGGRRALLGGEAPHDDESAFGDVALKILSKNVSLAASLLDKWVLGVEGGWSGFEGFDPPLGQDPARRPRPPPPPTHTLSSSPFRLKDFDLKEALEDAKEDLKDYDLKENLKSRLQGKAEAAEWVLAGDEDQKKEAVAQARVVGGQAGGGGAGAGRPALATIPGPAPALPDPNPLP